MTLLRKPVIWIRQRWKIDQPLGASSGFVGDTSTVLKGTSRASA
jgi:hypothetical protein